MSDIVNNKKLLVRCGNIFLPHLFSHSYTHIIPHNHTYVPSHRQHVSAFVIFSGLRIMPRYCVKFLIFNFTILTILSLLFLVEHDSRGPVPAVCRQLAAQLHRPEPGGALQSVWKGKTTSWACRYEL